MTRDLVLATYANGGKVPISSQPQNVLDTLNPTSILHQLDLHTRSAELYIVPRPNWTINSLE